MQSFPTVTVFGGNGFLGRVLISSLVQMGAVVRVPTRHVDAAWELKMAGAGQVVPYPAVSPSEEVIKKAVDGADAVINLLGILHEKGNVNGGQCFQNLHFETAARLARLARQQGVERFVQVSALGANVASASSYARSKAAGEDAVHTFFPKATILRPSVLFGPQDRFIGRLAQMVRLSPILPLFGEGETKFQPVYVGDVAKIIVRALTDDSLQGQIFELGGPQIYTFKALYELIQLRLNKTCRFINVPWGAAKFLASFMQFLPNVPLTPDQVTLLQTDNIVLAQGNVKSFADLGVSPTALELILPSIC